VRKPIRGLILAGQRGLYMQDESDPCRRISGNSRRAPAWPGDAARHSGTRGQQPGASHRGGRLLIATAFGIEAQMNGGYSIGSSARASQPLLVRCSMESRDGHRCHTGSTWTRRGGGADAPRLRRPKPPPQRRSHAAPTEYVLCSGTPDELCVCPEGLKRNLILDSW